MKLKDPGGSLDDPEDVARARSRVGAANSTSVNCISPSTISRLRKRWKNLPVGSISAKTLHDDSEQVAHHACADWQTRE